MFDVARRKTIPSPFVPNVTCLYVFKIGILWAKNIWTTLIWILLKNSDVHTKYNYDVWKMLAKTWRYWWVCAVKHELPCVFDCVPIETHNHFLLTKYTQLRRWLNIGMILTFLKFNQPPTNNLCLMPSDHGCVWSLFTDLVIMLLVCFLSVLYINSISL